VEETSDIKTIVFNKNLYLFAIGFEAFMFKIKYVGNNIVQLYQVFKSF